MQTLIEILWSRLGREYWRCLICFQKDFYIAGCVELHSVYVINSFPILNFLSLQSNFTRIEEMASGVAYCQLTDLLFPGKISLKKIKWNSRNEIDWIANWHTLQTAWKDLGVKKVNIKWEVPSENNGKKWSEGRFTVSTNISRRLPGTLKQNTLIFFNSNELVLLLIYLLYCLILDIPLFSNEFRESQWNVYFGPNSKTISNFCSGLRNFLTQIMTVISMIHWGLEMAKFVNLIF